MVRDGKWDWEKLGEGMNMVTQRTQKNIIWIKTGTPHW